ncbi:MAG: biotin/lipoyl-binding protein [Bacteroidales bacterium]|nr:biotin/lipoyl-binding protein [Bacteroidales bacterium]
MKEYKLVINGNRYNVVIGKIEGTSAEIEVNGTNYNVEFEKPVAKSSAPIKIIRSTPSAVSAAPSTGAPAAKPNVKPVAAPKGSHPVQSPLPGVILEIKCAVGDTVKRGDVILILEAMKMENVIEATANGKIKSINVSKGDSVLEGDTLIVIG